MKNRRRLIRPVTARYMHAKEIEAYEKESATPENRPTVMDPFGPVCDALGYP